MPNENICMKINHDINNACENEWAMVTRFLYVVQNGVWISECVQGMEHGCGDFSAVALCLFLFPSKSETVSPETRVIENALVNSKCQMIQDFIFPLSSAH